MLLLVCFTIASFRVVLSKFVLVWNKCLSLCIGLIDKSSTDEKIRCLVDK